jgi:hypothetical protein
MFRSSDSTLNDCFSPWSYSSVHSRDIVGIQVCFGGDDIDNGADAVVVNDDEEGINNELFHHRSQDRIKFIK